MMIQEWCVFVARRHQIPFCSWSAITNSVRCAHAISTSSFGSRWDPRTRWSASCATGCPVYPWRSSNCSLKLTTRRSFHWSVTIITSTLRISTQGANAIPHRPPTSTLKPLIRRSSHKNNRLRTSLPRPNTYSLVANLPAITIEGSTKTTACIMIDRRRHMYVLHVITFYCVSNA